MQPRLQPEEQQALDGHRDRRKNDPDDPLEPGTDRMEDVRAVPPRHERAFPLDPHDEILVAHDGQRLLRRDLADVEILGQLLLGRHPVPRLQLPGQNLFPQVVRDLPVQRNRLHPAGEEEFIGRYRKVTAAIKSLPWVCGYCYTQITDVQQETNGLLTAERKPKVDPEKIREINLA
jgi:hypothetical protein